MDREGELSKPIVGLVTQDFTRAGGVGTVSRWLASTLRSRGLDVRVFQVAEHRRDVGASSLLRPWRPAGPMLRWDESERIFRVGVRAGEIEFMRYLPRRELTLALNECDVVQVVGGSPALGYAASRCSVPVFLQMATFITWERPSVIRGLTRHRRAWAWVNSPPAIWAERRALETAQGVFIENQQVRAELGSRGVPAVVAPPGIDTKYFTPHENETGCRYILSVGRLSESRKGYERMLLAYAELRKMMPGAPPLILAGRGGLDRGPSQLIVDLDLAPHVVVRSDVHEGDLVPLLQGACLFWMTSYEEGLGLSAVEAMACGVPVVATDTAGTRVSVTEAVGALVSQSPFDPAEFARMSTVVLAAGKGMRAAARERAVRLFDTEVTIKPYFDAYRSALADRHGSGVTGAHECR